ncbi:hypothetical protein ACN47E_006131 [Coniothyrium glycines]
MGRVRKAATSPQAYGPIKSRLRSATVIDLTADDIDTSYRILEAFAKGDGHKVAAEQAAFTRKAGVKRKRASVDEEDGVHEVTAAVSEPARNLRARAPIVVPLPKSSALRPQPRPSAEPVGSPPPAPPSHLLRSTTAGADWPNSNAAKKHEQRLKDAAPRLAAYPARPVTRREKNKKKLSQSLSKSDRFAGTVILNRQAAYDTDEVRLRDITQLERRGAALVFFTDGSVIQNRMGAAVVWRDSLGWDKEGCLFRMNRCSANQAELCAIAMALNLAVEIVSLKPTVKHVRIYSDSTAVLEALLNSTAGSRWALQLAPPIDGKQAVQSIYEHADALKSLGIAVELHWVKGHHKSLGNNLADGVAGTVSSSGREIISRHKESMASMTVNRIGSTLSNQSDQDIGQLSHVLASGLTNASNNRQDGGALPCGSQAISRPADQIQAWQNVVPLNMTARAAPTNEPFRAFIAGENTVESEITGLETAARKDDLEIEHLEYKIRNLNRQRLVALQELATAKLSQSRNRAQLAVLRQLKVAVPERSRANLANSSQSSIVPIIDLTQDSEDEKVVNCSTSAEAYLRIASDTLENTSVVGEPKIDETVRLRYDDKSSSGARPNVRQPDIRRVLLDAVSTDPLIPPELVESIDRAIVSYRTGVRPVRPAHSQQACRMADPLQDDADGKESLSVSRKRWTQTDGNLSQRASDQGFATGFSSYHSDAPAVVPVVTPRTTAQSIQSRQLADVDTLLAEMSESDDSDEESSDSDMEEDRQEQRLQVPHSQLFALEPKRDMTRCDTNADTHTLPPMPRSHSRLESIGIEIAHLRRNINRQELRLAKTKGARPTKAGLRSSLKLKRRKNALDGLLERKRKMYLNA